MTKTKKMAPCWTKRLIEPLFKGAVSIETDLMSITENTSREDADSYLGNIIIDLHSLIRQVQQAQAIIRG